MLFLCRKFPLQLREFAIPQLGDFIQVVRSFGPFNLLFHAFDLLTKLLQRARQNFLRFPAGLQCIQDRDSSRSIPLRSPLICALLAASVSLLSASRSISIASTFRETSSSSAGITVDLGPKTRGRLIHQIDSLVRQKAVADISVDSLAAATRAASLIRTP